VISFATLVIRSKQASMPISDCDIRDPRMRRTRQLLQGALRELMRATGFDEISVQDIAGAATVNRATFYDHYTDKFALLEAMVASGFHRLLDERKVRYDGTCPSAASAIILATCDYLAQSRAGGAECRRQSAFEPLVDAAVVAAIRRVLAGGMPATPKTSGRPEIAAAAAAWAICGAAKQWLRTPNRPPADEIVPLVLQLVLPILENSAPGASGRERAGVRVPAGRQLRRRAM
jgi:AcrR family transcriptional regulator